METNLPQLMSSILERLQKMETTLSKLESEVEVLKSRPMNIEYKFDQLKVETLEGTLNIGLQPFASSPPTIDQFAVPPSAANPVPLSPHFDRTLYEQMMHYVDTEGDLRIQALATEAKVSVSDTYRHYMLEDIKRQMGVRIPYYVTIISQQAPYRTEDEETLMDEAILRMKRDIDAAFLAFIQTLPKNFE
ncbi:MAG: spore germination protein GerPC [Bacilli bacterium]